MQNMDSNSVLVFRIDLASGTLEPTGSRITVTLPSCIRMISRGL